MDADDLRRLQAPLKARYRENPAAARVTLTAEGKLDGEPLTCSVQTGGTLLKAGLHPATGGGPSTICSGDVLLQALAACAGVTLRAVATAIGISVRGGRVVAEGDLDFRGTLGVDKAAPVGLTAIRLSFDLDCDADGAQVAQLLKLTERYCVVYQTLRHGTSVSINEPKGNR
jgi:uncharacterized OsmC-like protein